MPNSRVVRRALAIAHDRAGTGICVCKHTDPRPVRGEETDCVLLVYRNTDQSPPLVSLIPHS